MFCHLSSPLPPHIHTHTRAHTHTHTHPLLSQFTCLSIGLSLVWNSNPQMQVESKWHRGITEQGTQTSSLRDCWKWKEIQGLAMLSCKRMCMCGGVWHARVCVSGSGRGALGGCTVTVSLLCLTRFQELRHSFYPPFPPFVYLTTSICHMHTTVRREIRAVCYTVHVAVDVSMANLNSGMRLLLKNDINKE